MNIIEIPFQTVDVFTGIQYGGNPLPVITDARKLDDRSMQKIAREFNHSETTFVLPPEDEKNTARVRIFTPYEELNFAGHPNVGTAYVLGRMGSLFGKPISDTMVFEEKAGLVKVQLLQAGNEVTGARITAPEPLQIGPYVELAHITPCLSIDAGHIITAFHKPCFASVGLRFVMVQLDGLEALGKIKANAAKFAEGAMIYAKPNSERFSQFLYVRMDDGIKHLRARMFSTDGHEDPATGSASAACAAMLTKLDAQADLVNDFHIEQGFEMGRPSSIEVNVRKEKGLVTSVAVTGQCVPVMRGVIEHLTP